MEKIKELIETNRELSPEQILLVFDYVGQNGDTILIKNDGLREHNKYTVVIIDANGPIRYDDDGLNNALIKSLEDYIKAK